MDTVLPKHPLSAWVPPWVTGRHSMSAAPAIRNYLLVPISQVLAKQPTIPGTHKDQSDSPGMVGIDFYCFSENLVELSHGVTVLCETIS